MKNRPQALTNHLFSNVRSRTPDLQHLFVTSMLKYFKGPLMQIRNFTDIFVFT